MFGRLMPRERRFFELFNQHAAEIVLGARELVGLLQQGADGAAHTAAIDAIEKRADKLTHETIKLLHRTFIVPLDREDIHALITAMDDILDMIQDVSESIGLYDVRRITPEACTLADICLRCAERVREAVGKLDDMRESEGVLKLCEEIDKLESDADRQMRAGISKLFREERDALAVIKLKAIYELLEAITDRCEDVANILEGIILENA
jgi:predicted phosphate transport protein (TIGR00153 family)